MSQQLQLSTLDRTILGYTGVPASQVAAAERVTVQAVHDSRRRLGRRPEDGYEISSHYFQAEDAARRARDLQRAKLDADAQAAWGEANYQVSLAVIDELMRTNRNPSL